MLDLEILHIEVSSNSHSYSVDSVVKLCTVEVESISYVQSLSKVQVVYCRCQKYKLCTVVVKSTSCVQSRVQLLLLVNQYSL